MMKAFREEMVMAVRDYRWLLDRKYPVRTILGLVGTRYGLSKEERSILFRGIATQEEANRRSNKHLSFALIPAEALHVDALNVLMTIAAYLRGTLVYVADDSWLRDVTEYHSVAVMDRFVVKAVALIAEFLGASKFREIHFYLDDLPNDQGEFATLLTADLSQLQGMVIHLSTTVDRDLSLVTSGVIATSDSVVIDRAMTPVTDLARAVIEHHFQPDFAGTANIF